MFNSLRSRLWFTYALLSGIILCVVGTGLVIYLIRNPPATTRSYQRLQIITTFLTRRPSLLGSGTLPSAAAALDTVDNAFDARIIILDPEGTVLVDTRAGEEPSIPKLLSLAIKSGNLDLSRDNLRFLDSQGHVWLYVARRIEENDILMAAVPRPPVPLRQILRDELIPPLCQAGLGAVVLALLLAIWMSRWVVHPLQRMTQSAQALAAGKHEPTMVEGPGEVQELARSFNEMSKRVHNTQQSQRDFVANVSHDLKTPLTSIQGFAQAILDGTANTPEELAQAAGVIYTEADRMHRLVLDLLELARMDTGIADFQRQPVDIGNLLRSLIAKLSPQAHQAQVGLRAEIGTLFPLTGDEDRLVQAFTNLVDNALKFTPAHGEVVIRAGRVGEHLEVSVTDTGPGIPTEDLSRIFDRFYQADKSRSGDQRGSGLGLAIAKEIILAHRGTITARSPAGRGSTFTVTLPITWPDDTTQAKRKTIKHPHGRG
jgi:two-component system OmpR family sensor kinase